ncbi:MAG: hypothetical protein J1F63_09530 [Oscillospiraceae bacterium]|nr:hypothetical protein [Oscillospiraceae bacterium]
MKKLMLALVVFAAIVSAAAYAEAATLPEFEVKINGITVDSEYREYPMLLYSDITYFPLTYYDCRFLGLSTEWDNDTRTLYIKKENITCVYHDYATKTRNNDYNNVEMCDFNIVINGVEIDNKSENYPLVTFRGVTYFPVTWRYASMLFGWNYSFGKNGLIIESDNYHANVIELPDYDPHGGYVYEDETRYGDGGYGADRRIATDGRYYYYQGPKRELYRSPVYDLAVKEQIFTFPTNAYDEISTAEFSVENGIVFISYYNGHPATATLCRYKISDDGTVVPTDEGTHGYVRSSSKRYEFPDDDHSREWGLKVWYTNEWGRPGETTVKYKNYDGPLMELYVPGVVFGESRYNGEVKINIAPQLHDDFMYIVGYDSTTSANSGIYRVNIYTGIIERIVGSTNGVFHVFEDIVDDTGSLGTAIAYCDGKVYTYTGNGIKETQNLNVDAIFGDYETLVMPYRSNEGGIGLNAMMYYNYYWNPFYTEAQAEMHTTDDCIYFVVKEDVPGWDQHLVVFTKDYFRCRPYRSSDMAENVFIYDNILLYTTEGKPVRVNLGSSLPPESIADRFFD